jgi:hypothetical protein
MAIKLQATTTVETTTTVTLKPQTRQMLVARFEEHAKLAAQARAINGKRTKKNPDGGRMKRLEKEIEQLVRADKQGKALVDGFALDGHTAKLVIGTRKKFDQMGFMKKHGLTQADFDEFTEEVDNAPYIKIGHGGDDEE